MYNLICADLCYLRELPKAVCRVPSYLRICIIDIQEWFKGNKLVMNDNKTNIFHLFLNDTTH